MSDQAIQQSEMLQKYLEVYVPVEKLNEFYLLLAAWTGAIVFSLLALLQLSKIYTVGGGVLDFDERTGKATKSCATFSVLALLCLILVQFLTLRVSLACNAAPVCSI
jgi:hypothetical protein